jgi:hypothetical protein
VVEVNLSKITQEFRDMWQSKALAHTRGKPLGAVMLSIISHNYDDALPALMQITFPGFEGITPPFLCSAGKIAKTGSIVADMATKDGRILKSLVVFRNSAQMRTYLRRLADELKLSDADRVEMFKAAQRWVVCDYRLDPNMDPSDPEAKRLVLH